ncbi:MAG: hypothetical protein ACRBN8_01290 [Nannocystales bacterium]
MNLSSKILQLGCLAIALCSACDSDSDSDSCPDGSETCPCTVDYKCLNGLTCLSDRCVDVSWTPPEDTPDTTNGNNSSGDFDNVAACEAWADSLGSLQCGFDGAQTGVDCSAYANIPCDLDGNGLFECFEDNVTCRSGMLDVSGLANCAGLATCE